MIWYVQCVGRKYEGILGSGEPRRSSRTKRHMLASGVRKVDSAGWNVSSHSWASDLQEEKQSVWGESFDTTQSSGPRTSLRTASP